MVVDTIDMLTNHTANAAQGEDRTGGSVEVHPADEHTAARAPNMFSWRPCD